MSEISIFPFGVPEQLISLPSKDVLGGKGYNLAHMSRNGLPVPPGLIIPCAASGNYLKLKGEKAQDYAKGIIFNAMARVELLKGKFGYMPLLSVRSGARVSMPGMMDTILNVGITSETLGFWEEKLGVVAALDSYRRLIQMLSSVALGVPMVIFDYALDELKKEVGAKYDSDLDESQLKRLISRYAEILSTKGVVFPDSLEGQLSAAIIAVFESWDNPRAKEYRKIHGYSDDWGTAVTIQSMVFGNMNDNSATGVVFTRCPSTGENKITGEFLVNAQGEDVVAGIRTPEPMTKFPEWNAELAEQFADMLKGLELQYRDMQDVEFTVQDGELFILQTRNGKRSALAAFKIARDMVLEGVITQKEAVGRVTRNQLLAVMSDSIDPKFSTLPDLVGIAAGGGVVSGKAVFSSADAVNCKEPCILITKETDPDDIAGMNASVGILTATGGLTSHAAVVARGMNKTCVVGCTGLTVENGYCYTDASVTVNQFTTVTIDGATGNVWFGVDVPLVPGGKSKEVKELLSWAGGDFSERLDLSPNMTQFDMQEEIMAVVASSLYVDTAMLELSKQPVDALVNLGKALTLFNGEEIIVDLTTLGSYLRGSDHAMDMMLAPKSVVAWEEHGKVDSLLDWPDSVLSKVLVKVPEHFSGETFKLVGKVCGMIGKVKTVADLLAASGPVEVTDDVITNVFGTKAAFEKIKEMVEEKTGKPLSGTLAPPVYWYNLLSEAA